MPDPDERGRVYEVMRARADAEAAERPGKVSDQRSGGIDRQSYWTEVPRFLAEWTDHEERWRADRPPATAADQPDGPPGSYRSVGGFRLSPEQNAETAEAVGRMREAAPTISADAQTAEKENTSGGWLEGFEFQLKGENRLKEKVAEQLRAEPRTTAGDALRQIPDAIRYTFCFQVESYTQGYYDIKARLESLGHQMNLSRNSWTKPEYKGINTRWVTREGQRFEVQFHTPESFHAKQYITHSSYERIRNPLTSDRERRELREFQREVSSAIRIPDGAAEIPDYEKEGF